MNELVVLPRVVQDGKRVLKFNAAVIGAATSERPGAPRWSELTIYRLPGGVYLVAKVGRSTVAHTPTCEHANPRRMRTFMEAQDEGLVHRMPCPECRPAVGDAMDPQTLLEPSRYTVLQAQSPESLVEVLCEGRDTLPEIVAEVLRQASKNDGAVAALYERSRT
jgi:hypothetical protein